MLFRSGEWGGHFNYGLWVLGYILFEYFINGSFYLSGDDLSQVGAIAHKLALRHRNGMLPEGKPLAGGNTLFKSSFAAKHLAFGAALIPIAHKGFATGMLGNGATFVMNFGIRHIGAKHNIGTAHFASYTVS